MNEQTDGELLREYEASGNEQALEELVFRYQAMVYRACLRMLGNLQDAQDAVQAVFIVLMKRQGHIQNRDDLSGWLHGVARNVCRGVIRERVRSRRKEMEADLILNVSESGEMTEGERTTILQRLDAELAALAPGQRQAVILRYLRGFSQEDAARIAGCPVGTLGRRACDGIATLRKRLAGLGASASVTALAGLLTSEASAAVPETLLPSILATVKTAAATTATATALPGVALGAKTGTSTAAMLAKGAMKAMFWNSVRTAAMVAVGVLLISGSAVVTYHAVTARRTAEERGKDERVGTAWRTNASRLAQSGGGLTVDRSSVARASNPAQSAAMKHPPVATAMKPAVVVPRAENDPLARIATEAEFEALAGQVMLIADDAERLQAIRQRLGMKISDEVYRKALEAHGNGNRVGNRLFKSILGTWIDADPEASLLWAQRLPETMKAAVTSMSLAWWMGRDRVSALAFAREHLSAETLASAEKRASAIQNDSHRQLVASGDFQELIRYAEEKTDPADWHMAVFGAVTAWAEKDPKAAAEYALGISKEKYNGTTRSASLIYVAKRWSELDTDAALIWANALPEEADRVSAVTAVAPAWARKHPDQPLDIGWLPESTQNDIVHEVVDDWAARDEAAAMKYAIGSDDPEQRKIMVATVAQVWGTKDPEAAIRWVNGQSAGEVRDAALSAIGLCMVHDPVRAEGLLNGIQDKAARQSALKTLVLRAVKDNPQQAMELADKLTPDCQEVSMWALSARTAKANAAVRAWVEKAHAAGRIKYPTYPGPAGTDPAVVRRWEQESAEGAYRSILEALSKAAKQ